MKKSEKNYLLIPILFFLLYNILTAQIIIFPQTPDWESSDVSNVSTGLGIADINQDDWEDIVIANGNDIYRQKLVVYYNNGDGTFPQSPSWQSGDIDYHGHLSIGDVNGDNLPDVAVSVFLGPAGFSEAGYAKVYFNQGTELESVPSFVTADSMFTFSCALGDADGDGDLDLAVAGGQPYSIGIGPYITQGRIYYNENGVLDSLPGWKSHKFMGALDVEFADFDNNGFLDLVFACELTPNYMYMADDRGSISTHPAWQSLDSTEFANSLCIAIVDNNDYLDLIISDNNQLGGSGKFKSYLFSAPPADKTAPGWESQTGGYGSAIIAEDLTNDNETDLLAGRWWDDIKFYPGTSTSFSNHPTWVSGTFSVTEAFAMRDLDKDGYSNITDTIFVDLDSIHVVYLSKTNMERISSVFKNGQPLLPSLDYCSVAGGAWLSVKTPLVNSDELIIQYSISNDRDLIVTNWDSNKGNYIFYNQTNISQMQTGIKQSKDFKIEISPNPFNQNCVFKFYLPAREKLKLDIFDLTGRKIKSFYLQNAQAGLNKLIWNGKDNSGISVGSGSYFYRINVNNNYFSGKLILIK